MRLLGRPVRFNVFGDSLAYKFYALDRQLYRRGVHDQSRVS